MNYIESHWTKRSIQPTTETHLHGHHDFPSTCAYSDWHILILAPAEAEKATVDEGLRIGVVLEKGRVRSEKYVS